MLVDRRREMVIKSAGGDLSLMSPLGGKLSSRETANCYVIKKPGTYWFPCVYGCGIVNNAENPDSYTANGSLYSASFYDANNSGITTPFIKYTIHSAEVIQVDTADFTITNLTIITDTVAGKNCKFIKFDVTSVPPLGGNAIIAAKYNDIIIWSWHIWAYPPGLSTFTHTYNNRTYKILNVNIGWVKDSSTSKYGTCPFYQWGRKDPFLRYGATSGTITTGSSTDKMSKIIRNPLTFNAGSKYYYQNWVDMAYFYNYWDASATKTGTSNNEVVKTVYDPSPVGFTIPPERAFYGFTVNNGGTWNSGWTWDGNFFQATGYRSYTNGVLGGRDVYGYSWLSHTISIIGAGIFGFRSDNVFYDGTYRSYGMPVRPVLRV